MDSKEIKCIINWENIKNKNNLKKIFQLLPQKNILKIIKCNKKIKENLNITINDYKKYSEIEIEIILTRNKNVRFINIPNKEEEKYYHIFFNDNKEEIKRTYTTEEDEAKKIKVIIDYGVQSFSKLFENCKYIQSINFLNFNRTNIINMDRMFYRCESLKDIKFSSFKTENVTILLMQTYLN